MTETDRAWVQILDIIIFLIFILIPYDFWGKFFYSKQDEKKYADYSVINNIKNLTIFILCGIIGGVSFGLGIAHGLPREISWYNIYYGLLGVFVGIAIGLSEKSVRMAILKGIGGLVGSLIAIFVFKVVLQLPHSLVGFFIGITIGLSEKSLRKAVFRGIGGLIGALISLKTRGVINQFLFTENFYKYYIDDRTKRFIYIFFFDSLCNTTFISAGIWKCGLIFDKKNYSKTFSSDIEIEKTKQKILYDRLYDAEEKEQANFFEPTKEEVVLENSKIKPEEQEVIVEKTPPSDADIKPVEGSLEGKQVEYLEIKTIKRCNYCFSDIQENEDEIVCSKCSKLYHNKCWEENGGCASFGCV